MLKITTEQQILETALVYVHSCKMCFDWQSTEKWVRMFANKRYDTLYQVQKDDLENVMPRKFRKLFEDRFTQGMMKEIEDKQRIHIAKEKAEKSKKKAIHRKGKR
jgi:hypothetical protein